MKLSTKSLSSYPRLTYLHLILISSILLQTVQVTSEGNETDRLALLGLKKSITSDPLGVLNSWNDSLHHCSWFGVICNNRHRRVAYLSLTGQKLYGSISPQIGNLSFLRYLNLERNNFRGAIPHQVGKLFRLQHLFLSNNTLGGEIPVNLSSCTKLVDVLLEWNNLRGKIPAQLGSLGNLQSLGLGKNNLTGTIPSSLGNLTSLEIFSVRYNEFVGEIPGEMNRLKKLTWFSVGINHLSGVIPTFLFNLSSIGLLSFTDNKFHGGLPDGGFNLPNLGVAYFGLNQLSGKIPSSLTNASQLESLDIGDNNFVGPIPSNLGDLSRLRSFKIANLSLGRNSMNDLDFLASLASCRQLEIVDITFNNLGGVLPDNLANFSTSLSGLAAGSNQISGRIPPVLGNFTNLIAFGLENNLLMGSLPSSIGQLQKLQELALGKNVLSGSIPSSIGNLSELFVLDLSSNNLEGSIPSQIGKCQEMNDLHLHSNNFRGQIPEEILNIPSLVYLKLYNNHLSGRLPQTIGKLIEINVLDISNNLLTGVIPATIGGCLVLEELHMQGNFFQREIPEAMASLKGLRTLDLSQNNLTGKIPKALQNLTYLQYLNISFNDLEGEVPTAGVFGNASAIFLAGNSRLCGGILELHLPKCPSGRSKKAKASRFKLPLVIGCLLLFVAIVAVLLLLFWKKRSNPKPTSSTFGPKSHIMVSYKNLHDATSGFSSQNLIGYGSFGSVYKGLLDQVGRQVAIKVLNLQQQGAAKSIIAECKSLSNIRHRNLVKLLTYCSSLDYKGNDFKALVFEFIPNGSLENWLHSEVNQPPRRLNILQRLNIAIDLASALHYLHDLCEVPIIHCDLKPSNVLLDDDMVAHIGDFGLAKFLSTSQTALQSRSSTIGIPGTTGYAAPEYGLGAAASKEGDIYSFGILLLETFSGRRPTDDIFADGLNLVSFIKESLPDRVIQVADPSLFTEAVLSSTREEEGSDQEVEPARHRTTINTKMRLHELTCLTSVMEIGVSCSEESPFQRANLGDVLRELHRVKNTFMSMQMNEDSQISKT